MGDSLTAPYAGTLQGSAGDRSWVEQFQALRPHQISIANQAVAGATSSSLLAQGQATAVATLVAHGAVDYAVLIVGANDISANLPAIFAGNPTPFVTTVVANIETALDTVAAAGEVGLVVGNIPDVGVTPYFRTYVTNNPFLLEEVTAAVTLANQQIEAFAAVRGIPVVDLFGLGNRIQSPLTVGGVQVNQLFAPDGFHPGTVPQGLLGNTVLDALHRAYDVKIDILRLSDQEILTEAGIGRPGRPTYFDVQPYVIFHEDAEASHLASGGKAVASDINKADPDAVGVVWRRHDQVGRAGFTDLFDQVSAEDAGVGG